MRLHWLFDPTLLYLAGVVWHYFTIRILWALLFFSFLFTTKDFDSHYFEMKTLPRNIKHLSKLETKRTWFVKIWPANCLLKTGLDEDTLMTVKLRQPSWFCSKWLYWPQHKQRQNRIMGLLVVILASNSKKLERKI